ncbi:hypothetical protein STEG23_024731 [Scotinomys teguina]
MGEAVSVTDFQKCSPISSPSPFLYEIDETELENNCESAEKKQVGPDCGESMGFIFLVLELQFGFIDIQWLRADPPS